MKERGREGERNSLIQAFFLGFRVNISLSAILNEVEITAIALRAVTIIISMERKKTLGK